MSRLVVGMIVAAFLGGFIAYGVFSYFSDLSVGSETTVETRTTADGDVQITTSNQQHWTTKLVVHLVLMTIPTTILLWLLVEGIRYLRATRKRL